MSDECPNTKIVKPNCSCSDCSVELMKTHWPGFEDAEKAASALGKCYVLIVGEDLVVGQEIEVFDCYKKMREWVIDRQPKRYHFHERRIRG